MFEGRPKSRFFDKYGEFERGFELVIEDIFKKFDLFIG
jgi:hypothetical protein